MQPLKEKDETKLKIRTTFSVGFAHPLRNNGAMEDMCKVSSPTYRQEKCYVSQDRPIQDALERLYNLYTTQTCDMSHTDVAHVPTDKSMFLLIAYFCDHYKHQSPPYPVSSHSPTYYYDPISYYIYGLRKIVI